MAMSDEHQFSLTGGAWLSWRYTSLYRAKLSVDEKALHLSCFGEEYKFPKSSITNLKRYRWLTSIGLRIDHTMRGYSGFVVFWVCTVLNGRRFALLRESLEALG
jgi:hypothetical protein